MSDYFVITLSVDPNDEAAVRCALLDAGAQGTEALSGQRVKVYIAEQTCHAQPDRWLKEICGHYTYTIENSVIIGLSENAQSDEVFVADLGDISPDIFLHAASVFGSGRHPTTRLLAQYLRALPVGSHILDVGAGSGILSILAAKLGWKNISAVEIDALARGNAVKNFSLNKTTGINLFASLASVKGKYDCIVANVPFETQMHLAPEIICRLSPGAHLILGGFSRAEWEELKKQYSSFQMEKYIVDADWVMVVLT